MYIFFFHNNSNICAMNHASILHVSRTKRHPISVPILPRLWVSTTWSAPDDKKVHIYMVEIQWRGRLEIAWDLWRMCLLVAVTPPVYPRPLLHVNACSPLLQRILPPILADFRKGRKRVNIHITFATVQCPPPSPSWPTDARFSLNPLVLLLLTKITVWPVIARASYPYLSSFWWRRHTATQEY